MHTVIQEKTRSKASPGVRTDETQHLNTRSAVNTDHKGPVAGAQNDFNYNFGTMPVHAGRPGVQTKLNVNIPGDSYEQEADAMADKVMYMREGTSEPLSKDAHAEKDGKFLQQNPVAGTITPLITGRGDHAASADPVLADKIESSRGQGTKMDANTGSFMSGRFGADFSHVKIHTDSQAAGMNRELNPGPLPLVLIFILTKENTNPGLILAGRCWDMN